MKPPTIDAARVLSDRDLLTSYARWLAFERADLDDAPPDTPDLDACEEATAILRLEMTRRASEYIQPMVTDAARVSDRDLVLTYALANAALVESMEEADGTATDVWSDTLDILADEMAARAATDDVDAIAATRRIMTRTPTADGG